VASWRMLYAMSRRNLMHPGMSRVHSVNQTPTAAILAVGITTGLAIFMGEALLVPILEVGAITSGLGWMAGCASYFCMKPPWPRRTAAVLGLIVTSAVVLVKLVPWIPGHFTWHEWIALTIWVALGAAVRESRSRHRELEPQVEVASLKS